MNSKRLLGVVVTFVLGINLGTSFAQNTSHTHGESHKDQSNQGDEHDGHDMGEMDEADAQNSFIVAGQTLRLDPLILADGSFHIGVRLMDMMSDSNHSGDQEHNETDHDGESTATGHDDMSHGSDMMMPALAAITPDGETLSPLMVHGTQMNVMTFPFGASQSGIYRVRVTVGEDSIEIPIGLYLTETDMTKAYLVLTPNPSLSSRGQSQSFLYAFREGEALHDDLMLKRSMSGMQHITDDEELNLEHTHFDDVYNDMVGEEPMANKLTLGFAMAGIWDVGVQVMGDAEETLSFKVDVLDE